MGRLRGGGATFAVHESSTPSRSNHSIDSALRSCNCPDNMNDRFKRLPADTFAMATLTSSIDSDLAMLSRLIRPERHGLPEAAARAILEIDFEQSDRERMNDLAEKAGRGTLTYQENSRNRHLRHIGHIQGPDARESTSVLEQEKHRGVALDH